MRTTVQLDPDTTRAVEELRREGRGVSEAVNELIRRGLTSTPAREPFVGKTYAMGAKIDLTNIGEVLDLIEGPDHR